MNKFLNAIAITATLILAQGCSLLPKAEEKAISASTHQHQEPAKTESHHEGHSTGSAVHGDKKVLTQAKLKAPSNIIPDINIPIFIEVQDLKGKPVSKFDTFQEKLMHLIVVSDDLQFFSHLHPTYKDNGKFEVLTSFPQAGGYTFFSDYKPAGQAEQISVLKAEFPRNTLPSPQIDLNRSKTFGDIKVNLNISEATVSAGEEVTLMFKLQDAANNQPLTDLQPYLGEKGHLVILRKSNSLTAADYIHAHALNNTPTGEVHFMTNFPQPGKYKLWGQFQRNGKIITADFWVNVI
ncbi:hypothetical protein H6G54_29255 [Anabaena cylindrica FACHB-243]|uniref:YtkA-like domain-containing protein n=1 Tax=Anabaena cylindrica (strain ATCC 27899 / PCC 7122) TaxID=272123 RepID=K9ZPX6_ANACC|nr:MULTISPECIES: hypothetical protein [Anabaena]AFZ61216.1 hypothetical protein Anacy_5932 [Anabaena cylindrica PCC 7122]MBD2421692.1 hypothetical protein [Anabaena cylindrica FACHB-243]MBY5280551.1 hypothetical protein [Anabaena sp. CCAP 1446/1C]MBY5308140.1 hypothetical protein [Anabaena sp. CCAP 1446/1C]MCM2405405.1 hypothetical protein [Anabaena sp. CCAP 1446/1C]